MKTSGTTTITKSIRIELTDDDIRRMLRTIERFVDLPDDAEVTISVPGGRDWWNTALVVGFDAPVVVQWHQVTKAS